MTVGFIERLAYAPGKYKVAAGYTRVVAFRYPDVQHKFHGQTFYPSTTDEAKATVIEVSEGSETKDVDIVMAGRGPAASK